MSGFAKRLRMALNQAQLKQSQLAEKIGAPRSAVSQYLDGMNEPKPERLERMAQALGCTEAFLRGEEPAPEDPPEVLPVKNISTAAAARCMGKSNQFVRVGLQQGALPFGAAVRGAGSRYNYYISPAQFRDYVGPERFDAFFLKGV